MLKSARRCCVCRRIGHHIHHIDGDKRNHDFENLALLCFDCHHEASIRGGLKRRLTASEIRKLRADWYAAVERRGQTWARQLPDQAQPILDPDCFRAAVIDALAISEIRAFAIEYERGNWEALTGHLKRLLKYVDHFSYGSEVQRELLQSMYAVTGWVRSGMPYKTASALEQVISASLPIRSVVAPHRQPFTAQEIERMKTGCNLAFGIAYDGLLKLANLAMLDLGLKILWEVARVACLDSIEALSTHAGAQFEHLRQAATRAQPSVSDDAIAWINFQEADARDLDLSAEVVFPSAVEARIVQHREIAEKGNYRDARSDSS
jgi:hypothetical protein